jgi:CRP-like cAMP-binding protein
MSLYTGKLATSTNNSQQHFTRRCLLPSKKGALWRIESGFVMNYTYLEDGTTVALGLWGPGDTVGELLSTMKPYQIECLTNVEATIQQAEELMLIRSHRKVETMLMQLLAWLSKKFGSEVEKGRLIDMRLTHEDLAALINSTRVTITRVLGQLEQEGLIDRLSLHRIMVKQDDIWYYEI